jgi:hypothetical protein
MAQAPKKKRRRKVPANIVEKTDREIMEKVLGKRVLREVDSLLEANDAKPGAVSTEGR